MGFMVILTFCLKVDLYGLKVELFGDEDGRDTWYLDDRCQDSQGWRENIFWSHNLCTRTRNLKQEY